jgi:hypothetical protein
MSLSKSSMSPQRRKLIELLQSINFGRIENLLIRDREPVFSPAPRITREHKFGGENGPRPESGSTDFLLKAQVIELFALLDELRDGTIAVIEVKHGLPFRAQIADAA